MRGDVFDRASPEAHALGHHWMGAEHVLLALVAGQRRDPAATALASLGLTHELAVAAVRQRVSVDGPPIPRDCSGILSIATYHDVQAAATAAALARGYLEPRAEDVLLGLVSLPSAHVTHTLLDDVGVTTEAIREALVAAGVPVGSVPASAAPHPLLAPAERQAIQFGEDYIGTWHVLLALLSGEPDDLAQRALDPVGLTYGRYARWCGDRRATWEPPSPSPRSGITASTPNPATRQLFGRAQGFASSARAHVVRSEHGLLAWLWESSGNSIIELERLSTSAAAVLAELADLGVLVPSLPLPEPVRESRSEKVDVPMERLMDVVHELERRLPSGGWGFNHHQGQAWVIGCADIDLHPIVVDVLTGL